MSEDRLEEIKGYREAVGNVTDDEIDWLISELEKCKKDVADWRGLTSIEQDTGMGWKDRAVKAEAEYIGMGVSRDNLQDELEKCREETQLLNALFDMQQTRMKKAIELWQQATGKKDVLPDLGVLLEWLMAEPERLKEVAENWRSMEQASSLMASVRKVRVEKQRRHRKWALKKAKSYLYNPCATVVYDAGETRTRLNDWLI